MNQLNTSLNVSNWQEQAQQYLVTENYGAAVKLYEQAIEEQPDIKSYYWHLGLLLLLQGQETEAQFTWFSALSEDADINTKELTEVLDTEAKRRITIEDYHVAWAIRKHIQEIAPEDINNILHLSHISLQLESFKDDLADILELIINTLSITTDFCDTNLLIDVIKLSLVYITTKEAAFDSVFNLVEVCLQKYPDSSVMALITTVMLQCIEFSAFYKRPDLAAKFAELCLQRVPKNYHIEYREILTVLSFFYQNGRQFEKGIETAKLCYDLANNLSEKISANFVVLRGLMSSGSYWQEAYNRIQDNVLLTETLIESKPDDIHIVDIKRLFVSLFFLPYFDDIPKRNHKIQNQLSSFCQSQVIKNYPEIAEQQSKYLNLRIQNIKQNQRTLNIGYISHCFKRHSVSWLCRWIFKYHNPEKFKIHCYFVHAPEEIEIFTQNSFVSKSHKFYKFGLNENERIWNQIKADEIDILVDLDSLTLDQACELMSIKSAPIQVTWLGWDSYGLPSIDYFIADPYVLPESAQDYYSETIWRLPQTYIAVDGFEVDVPSLRREDLEIPGDAIIYFMTQKGYKRHLPHLHLQMKIVKAVPNSYILIKGDADLETSKVFFEEIAKEEGVDFYRIKFLPTTPTEAIHRANLQIADVVLDTYPYNGATTTLETLWMGVPLVTRVGEQFSARNSYTMMINAGITEGIAWTEEEYLEWGIRLGKDEELRQQIAWKLRQSRHKAPLWNAKKFTLDMEKAYEEMWQRYIDA
ncbi:O-linked N-acetylglucosamine transferase, SPINDLY family protein [Sphaerospermopsis aphanizomenoides BCCUSP55]|uniref:O-linked N-acetylglucosamine transferase, SPINDLY family protein n=1 Tax=Sphaerospermopsis aphanizomenoides TaxID=459663 RepID=UPI001905461A|nr:O-linked N-acetylglucosamine transferase, SPINDLY family protein [Sphaerospermopsis aphanizomenoides]MBK1989754.1 O-linked N-acetylglucosamine transferase, SPINDLY family protein [Sphaerospermopsis aphanizomenoides BCCUSP55]